MGDKMVTSHDTITKIYQVLARHLSFKQIRLVLDDLTMVPGNASFRDTVIRLQHHHADWISRGKTDVAVSKEEPQGETGTGARVPPSGHGGSRL
jgi:hypothetical protein